MKEHLGQFYDKTSDFQQTQFNTLVQLAVEAGVHTRAYRHMLDIGSGTGSRTRQCFDAFAGLEKITAIEPDWEMMAVAREQYSDVRIDYHCMKAEDLHTLSLALDSVISNWSLHWVSDKEKLMQDLNRQTTPGSTFMFSTCEELPGILQMIDAYIRQEFLIHNAKSPFFYLTAAKWNDLLTRHGWKILKQEIKPLWHDVEDAAHYLNHWFTASAAKFMYGRHIFEFSPLSKQDLISVMQRSYPSAQHPAGLTFREDAVFIIAEKI